MSIIAGVGDFGLQAIANETKAYRDETLNYVNGRFPQSLSVYVDGTNGDDARTGLTNDSNASTGRVKTLSRVAALYSGKVSKLFVIMYGAVTHNSIVTLDALEIRLHVNTGGSLTFSKRSLGSFGEGTNNLRLKSNHVFIFNEGTINVEAHAAPPGSSTEFNYFTAQGAICLAKSEFYEYDAPKNQRINLLGGTVNVGNYTTFITTGRDGGEYNPRAIFGSSGIVGVTISLGTNSVFHDLVGDRILLRNYTPTSSTDAKVSTGEVCYDANFLYGKISGTIKKIAWTAF